MASTDLLEELKLSHYYPQKLSFSEAIKLRGKSKNGCQKLHGLEIVRRLLMFDSTAVISVTAEINERRNNTVNKETKKQCVSAGELSRKGSVRPSKRSDMAEQNQRKLHPMDLLVVVMNCCDDLLRQILVEKMFANKLSIPILLPSVRNGSYTLLLLALRSLVPEVQYRTRESSDSLSDILVDVKNPIVSFIRAGDLYRSKSKLINDLLNPNSFNTFFHRECPNGSVKRSVSNGSIEAAWFQSSTAKPTEEEFNCRFFTALNLRGNAKDYPKQTQFLCQSSTLVVFLVDSFESFKELYEKVLEEFDVSQTKTIVCNISSESPIDVDDQYIEFLEDLNAHGIISEVKYDWHDRTTKMSDNEFTNDLRKTISEFSTPEYGHSKQLPTYTNITQREKNFGFSLDEDKCEYKLKKGSADRFVELIMKLPPDCKPMILPLQGEPWGKIGKLEREQRAKTQDKNQDEYFIAEKETDKRRQRELQCRSLFQQNKIAQIFSLDFHLLQGQNLLYYLNCLKIKLDARNRVLISTLIEEYKKEKQQHPVQQSCERESEVKLSIMKLKIENSTIGLEHILREIGQMYEAVISEEIRMKKELKKAPLTPDVIHNFPKIVARLLLVGQPLELMDGDASNVPITWLKAVLNKIRITTNNAKIFVLSIIGVQSSGKSTLLNALFGLQFPVSAGRCTKGIYCHLVPVDKESLIAKYDYVLVVDTEGLGSSRRSGNSTFKDNELATFAVGLADATIINMKGENWSEMKDILQIVAHGLIRVRKTKKELELMPRCMFVHQNVLAVDAEEKNRLGQEKQLMLLDNAIRAAGHEEGFTDINKFADVIKYDPGSHSWYFPDLWNGKPPKARISKDYVGKTSELRQYLMQLMRNSASKLTVSSFFLRMSDLWNAILHNEFVLCFRNTQEIISGTVLNDRISHEVNGFKNLNKLEQTKIHELICSSKSFEEFRAEKERIPIVVSDAVEKNFAKMKTTVQEVIDSTDICAALKKKYDISLNEIKFEELRRIEDETGKVTSVHMKKLECNNDQRVKDLKARVTDLEKCIEEVEKDKLNETSTKEFEESWQHLFADHKILVDERMKIVESEIVQTIRGTIQKFSLKDTEQMDTVTWGEIFKTCLVDEMPQVTENDIVQNEGTNSIPSWAMDFVYSKSHVYKAKSCLHDARRKWELQFQNHKDLEFNASHLEKILFEVGQLLGIVAKEDYEVRTGADEICSSLPPGYIFTRDYISRFIKFACHYTYNRSLENSKGFISISDPLSDIGDRYLRSVSCFQQKTAEANINAVSKQIFDFAERSFVKELGELIKTEMCQEDNKNPTFMSKRAFLTTILTDLGQRTYNSHLNKDKEKIFNEFMLYVEVGGSEASENFFLDVILKLLKEMLTKENALETDFQKMVKNNVGSVVEKAKNALRQAETKCEGCAKEYVRIFKDDINLTSEISFRINSLSGFTEAVVEKIDSLFADFLSRANSSFEILVCKDNKAAIRTVFEKIMGCREKCPFCSAPCSQSLHQHAGDHRANHYPMGVSGTVECWGLFTDTQETRDATKEEQGKPEKLALDTCQAMVGGGVDIRTKVTVQKYAKLYHRLFNWNYHSFKNYKEIGEYENWDIPHCQDPNASLYWKWFMAQFDKELAKHYKVLRPEIPESWGKITWEEAKKSLGEADLNF